MSDDILPREFRSRPFLRAEALPVTGRARLARRDLVVPARGLRATTDSCTRAPPELFLPLLRPDQRDSHLTAAALWGIPVPVSSDIHVTTVGRGPVMRRHGFVGHRASESPAAIQRVGGLPVSGPLDAWLECAPLLSHRELVIAGDHLVGRHGTCEPDDLEAIARQRGRRGVLRLREALVDVRVGSESPRETRLRLQLVDEGFRVPLLNCSIHDGRGRFVARPDLLFSRERVCVEYDGDHHRTDRTTFRDDKRRREALADEDWHALYVSDDDLAGPNWRAFVARLRRALARGELRARGRDPALI